MKEHSDHFSLAAFARSLQLPQDYAKGNLSVFMEGQERICIENFKGISSYTAEEVRLIADRRRISVTGKNLKIDCYTKDEIEISGCICKVEYL